MQNYVTSPEQNAPQHGSSASISNILQQPPRPNTTRAIPSEFTMEQGGGPPASKRRKSGATSTFVSPPHQTEQALMQGMGQFHFGPAPVYFVQAPSRNNNTGPTRPRGLTFGEAVNPQVALPTSNQVITNHNNQQHGSIPGQIVPQQIGFSNQIQINNSQQQQQMSQQILHQHGTNQGQVQYALYPIPPPLQQIQQVQQQIQPMHTSPIMESQLYTNDNILTSNISTQEPLQQILQRLEFLKSQIEKSHIENKESYQLNCEELHNLLQHDNNVYSARCQESLFQCLKSVRNSAPLGLEIAVKVIRSAMNNIGRFSNLSHQHQIRKWHSELKSSSSGVNDRGSRSNTLNSGNSLNRIRQQQQQQQQQQQLAAAAAAQLLQHQQINAPVPPRIEQRPITDIEKANANWISRIIDRAWGHIMLPYESHITSQHRGEQEFVFVNSFYIPHEKFERIWKPDTPFPPVHIHPNKLPVSYRLISRKPCNLDDDNKCDWPPEEATFKIHINDLEVKLNRKQRIPIKSNQYSFVGVDKPVDIVQYLVAGVNKIKFTQCMCEPCRQQLYEHILSIEVLVKETEEIVLRNARSQTLTIGHGTGIVKRLISGPSSSKQSSTSSIGTPCHNNIAMVIDDDCDITVNKMKVSLRCPISLLRISEPAKGQNCRHIGCFDLHTYVNVNKKNCKWRCPECNDRVTSETLRIDEFFKKLLHDVPDKVNTVELDSSGKWTVVGQDDGDGGETTDDDDVMQIDPISKKSSLTSTTSKSDKASAAIIISDDEDEIEPHSSNNHNNQQQLKNTFVQPQRPIAIRQSSTPGVPYMQPIRPSNIQTNESVILQSPPPSASMSLPTLMQSPPEINALGYLELRQNNTPNNTPNDTNSTNSNSSNKKKRNKKSKARHEKEVTQEKGNSSTKDNNNDISSSSRSWLLATGIASSQPSYNNSLSPQDIAQTATQVASPISPVSVTNPNLSHPMQDEEEEGEWLTEDEQEEVVLDSLTASTASTAVKKPYLERVYY